MLAHPIFQSYNSLIHTSLRWKKNPTYYASFPLQINQFKIKEVTTDVAENYVSTLFFTNVLVPEKKKENMVDIVC